LRELFVGLGIRLYARLSRRGFDIIPALLPELISCGQSDLDSMLLTHFANRVPISFHGQGPPHSTVEKLLKLLLLRA
jgi:hypothetical protein